MHVSAFSSLGCETAVARSSCAPTNAEAPCTMNAMRLSTLGTCKRNTFSTIYYSSFSTVTCF